MQQARLHGIMRRELEFLQLQLSPYCLQRIEQLIANGLKRMRASSTLDHPGYIMQSERNLISLIKYFGDYAKRAGTFPALRDNDFDTALRTCPAYWPFSTSG